MSQTPFIVARAEPFDHGAALRVPAPHDKRSRALLMTWLGEAGTESEGGRVSVMTRGGTILAAPGDWVVLSVGGEYHVAFSGAQRWDA